MMLMPFEERLRLANRIYYATHPELHRTFPRPAAMPIDHLCRNCRKITTSAGSDCEICAKLRTAE